MIKALLLCSGLLLEGVSLDAIHACQSHRDRLAGRPRPTGRLGRGPGLSQWSAAIDAVLTALLRTHMDAHIAAEAAKLVPLEEQHMAEEGWEDYQALAGGEGSL